MTDLHRSLAANVKTLRQRLGWSQAELAERADVSVSYVGDIEAGEKWPAAEKLESLAGAFRVQAYQLFLNPQDTADYQAWLERRDVVAEFSEKVFRYFENRTR
jgi:transcriptional regulator with XRE-family HTH domain